MEDPRIAVPFTPLRYGNADAPLNLLAAVSNPDRHSNSTSLSRSRTDCGSKTRLIINPPEPRLAVGRLKVLNQTVGPPEIGLFTRTR